MKRTTALVLLLAAALAIVGSARATLFFDADDGRATSTPYGCPEGHERFVALLSGLSNVVPNATQPQPLLSPVKGAATVCLDPRAKHAAFSLLLCHFLPGTGGYVAAHIHVGAPYVDYPPPLVALEPAGKPYNSNAPPSQLPQLAPAVFFGCRLSEGEFGEGDIVSLPPSPLPTVTPVRSFDELVGKARAGELYVNVHSVTHPAGEARGNLYAH